MTTLGPRQFVSANHATESESGKLETLTPNGRSTSPDSWLGMSLERIEMKLEQIQHKLDLQGFVRFPTGQEQLAAQDMSAFSSKFTTLASAAGAAEQQHWERTSSAEGSKSLAKASADGSMPLAGASMFKNLEGLRCPTKPVPPELSIEEDQSTRVAPQISPGRLQEAGNIATGLTLPMMAMATPPTSARQQRPLQHQQQQQQPQLQPVEGSPMHHIPSRPGGTAVPMVPEDRQAMPPPLQARSTVSSSASFMRSGTVTQALAAVSASHNLPEILERQAHVHRLRDRGVAVEMIWSFLTDQSSSPGAKWFHRLMNPIIVMSTVIVLLEGSKVMPQLLIVIVETIVNALFLVEIVLRFVTCPSHGAFVRHWYNMIDIVALVPFILRCSVGYSTEMNLDESESNVEKAVVALILGGTPFFRLLKLLRRYEQFHLIMRCFQESLEALPVMFYIISVMALFFSSLLYIVEPRSNIATLTDALWLTIVTMLTVGYGDSFPVSPGGKIIATGLMFAGCLFMAIPIGIIGNTFNNVWEHRLQVLMVLRARERLTLWGYHPSDIPAFFKLCDRRGRGYITYKEFRYMLSVMQLKFTERATTALFEVFDQDGNGKLDHWEFLRVVFPEYYFEVWQEKDGERGSEVSSARRGSWDGLLCSQAELQALQLHNRTTKEVPRSGSDISSLPASQCASGRDSGSVRT